jgi:type 1 glutamine amidotransferase
VRRILSIALIAILGACNAGGEPTAPSPTPSSTVLPRVLLFTKTAKFRHDAIGPAVQAIRTGRRGFEVDATEDATVFSDRGLAPYAAVAFLLTTGDVLDAPQQAAFERFIRRGGGYVGVHSASDTEYDWPFYGRLVGAYFASHPAPQRATIVVEDGSHPSTTALPARWTRTDEWYNFRLNPRAATHVLAALDESTYEGGSMGRDHPITWCHVLEGGRAWYTAGGHVKTAYAEPLFLAHLIGGIRWASGLDDADCG